MNAQSAVPPSALAGSSPAAQEAAFADDPRVHFDRASGTWRLENDDGSELEYDAAKGAWVPVVSITCRNMYARTSADTFGVRAR